jgi:hypothetical protein
MPNNVRHPAYLKFATACIAGAFVAMAAAPTVADEQFAPTAIVQLPDAQILSAFDISFVEPKTHTLAIAASRVVGSGGPFGTVIIVNTQENLVTKELRSNPPFIGNCTFPNRSTYNGPNGVIVIENGRKADVWAGDAPEFNTHCVPGSGLKTPSTVKVLDLHTGATKAVIETGNGKPGTMGIRRADELCYSPDGDVVLIANPDPLDNFITFIGEDSYKVLQRIRFDGTDPNGDHIFASGIEQCVFKEGKFYLNIPATGPTGASPGLVVRISTHAPFHVEAVFDFAKPPLASTGCGGAAGMAAGPDHQLGLACGGANALIIDNHTGNPIPGGVLTGEGGADEMWYNPGDNHYFFAQTGATALGVVDAGPAPKLDPSAPTAPGSHSLAADPRRNQVYVPIRGNTGVMPPFGTLCSKVKDVFGNAGSDALGCIAIYTAPRDKDDRRAERDDR